MIETLLPYLLTAAAITTTVALIAIAVNSRKIKKQISSQLNNHLEGLNAVTNESKTSIESLQESTQYLADAQRESADKLRKGVNEMILILDQSTKIFAEFFERSSAEHLNSFNRLNQSAERLAETSDHFASNLKKTSEKHRSSLNEFTESSIKARSELDDLANANDRNLAALSNSTVHLTDVLEKHSQTIVDTIEKLEAQADDAAKKVEALKKSDNNNHQSVTFAAFSPRSVAPGDQFVLDIWAFVPEQEEQIQIKAAEVGNVSRSGTKSGLRLSLDAHITIRLTSPMLVITDPEDGFFWSGDQPVNTSFPISVPESLTGIQTGTAHIYCEGFKVGKLVFSVDVKPQAADSSQIIENTTREFRSTKSAFASYSRRDQATVFSMLQVITKFNPDIDVFLDLVSLRSGENWEKRLTNEIVNRDIFYLFWSKNAAESEWVEKEWRLALKRRGLDYIDPIPLDQPSDIPPPVELAELHFDDFFARFRAGIK